MSDIFDHHGLSVEQYLHDITWLDGQVGAAFAIDGCIVGLDVFDSQNVAHEYLPKVIRSYALDAIAVRLSKPALATASTNPDGRDVSEVAKLLEEISSIKTDSFPAVGLGTDCRIDSHDITGAALILDDHVVHLSAFRKQGIAAAK